MKRFSYLDMVKELLSEKDFLRFEKLYMRSVKKSVKLMKSRLSEEVLREELWKSWWELQAPEFSFDGRVYDDVLFVEKEDKQSLGSHFLHQAGCLYVQEMAAGMSVQVLFNWEIASQARNDLVVLDMCGAPGGKSVQIADRLKSVDCFAGSQWQSVLIANEMHPWRRKALQANLERCGFENVLLTGYDGRKFGELLSEQCDKVLLDAPCSGEGMQYKSDFKVYQWNEKVVRKIASVQEELLVSGLQALKVWGELVYSTCTTNVIENELVVAKVLERFGDAIELLDVEINQKSEWISEWRGEEILDIDLAKKLARFWPHVQGTGGFFIAKFRKVKKFLQEMSLSWYVSP